MKMSSLLVIGARRRRLTLLFLVIMTLALGSGLPRLQIDTSIDLLFDRRDPEMLRYQQVVTEFGSDTTAVLHFRDPQLFTPARLAAIEGLVRALEDDLAFEKVDSVFSSVNFRDDGGALVSQPILDRAPATDEEAARALKDALYNPLISGNLVSADGRAMVVIGRVGAGGQDEVNARLEQLLAPLKPQFEHIAHVGPLRTAVELKRGILDDVMRMAPLSVVVLAGTVMLMLRRIRLALLPLTTGLLSVVWTFGFIGLMGITVNMLMPILIALLVCVAATEDIHIIASYFEAREEQPAFDRMACLSLVSRRLSTAIAITVATTVFGFASNAGADVQIVADFAISATAGILFNGVATVLALPLMLSLIEPGKAEASQQREALSAWLSRLAVTHIIDPALRHEKRVLFGATLLVMGGLTFALNSQVNNDPIAFFGPRTELVRETLAVGKDMSGIQSFYVTVRGPDRNAFLSPDALRFLLQIKNVVAEEGFDRAISIADHLSLIHREMNGGDQKYYVPPDNRELVEQYLLFFQRSDLASYLSSDCGTANVVVRHNIFDSTDFNERLERVRQRLSPLVPAGFRVEYIGKSLLINKAAETLVTNEMQSLAMALTAIVVVLATFFSSFRVGVLAVIPNLVPIILVYATVRMLGVQLNPATIMVAAITIGIAVDDTTHLLVRYNQALRRSSAGEAVVREVVAAETVPVLTSTTALIGGFAVALTSSFAAGTQFGLMACLSIFFGLATELALTPLMLRRVHAVSLLDVLMLRADLGARLNSPLLAGLSRYRVKQLLLLSQLRSMAPGEVVMRQGDIGDEMMLVLSGTAEVSVKTSTGQRVVDISRPGDVIGEVGFLAATERTATVTALEAMEVLVMNQASVQTRLLAYPRLAAQVHLNLARILGERLVKRARLQAAEGLAE